GNESRADFCVHESEKVSKNQARMETQKYSKIIFFTYFKQSTITKKKKGSRVCALEPLCLQSERGDHLAPLSSRGRNLI
ncbi:MAG: hypothetical protein PUF65_06265, partial [Lachnospiraceae bacterium]|nr:hypothetical protein [Lachnospiraceae bacterium]